MKMAGWYLYSVICELIGLGLFLYGFFLVNYDNGKVLSNHQDYTPHDYAEITSHVSKTVMVVIDALRYDFVVGNDTRSTIPYLHSLVQKREASVFPCRVHLPTVTMPRIKAMTVGDTSNFLDIALNFGSTQIKYDNIISQMKRKGMKVVFYGDDTWTKLFPNSFYREEGVSSFFVSDFYQVDNIVTKNMEDELTRNDWDVMILHYLGLDHIGHVEGPKSPKISTKLQEMDKIIEKLHNHLLRWKADTNETFLLIITADHGMRDSGGHGGASAHETLVPLVTAGINCSSDGEISQVDLAVTLALLMGLPIPRESVGQVIPQFVEHLPLGEKLTIHRRVAKHLMKKYIQLLGPLRPDLEDLFTNAHQLYRENGKRACDTLQFLSNSLRSSLVAFLTKFDILYLLLGVIITIQASCLPLTNNKTLYGTFFRSLPLTGLILVLLFLSSYFYQCQSALCDPSRDNILVLCLLTTFTVFNTLHLLQYRKLMIGRFISAVTIMENDSLLAFFIVGLLLQMLTTLSTSLIEEEHMYWYFLWATLLVLLLRQYWTSITAKFLIVLLVLHRILKKLNQTGDQYASLPDISDWLAVPERKFHLTVFLIFGLSSTFWVMRFRASTAVAKREKTITDMFLGMDKFCDAMCLIFVFLYRVAVGEVVFFGSSFLSNGGFFEVQMFTYFIACSILLKLMKRLLVKPEYTAWSFLDLCIEIWILITALVMRPQNVVLIGALVLTSMWLRRIVEAEENKEIKIIVSHYWLAYVYFFYQGNSNSLATIYVPSGYIGQSDYNMLVAGLLILINTYAMPVLAHLLMLKEIQSLRRNAVEPAVRLLLIFINANVTFYLIVMIIQRHHLFIWSVFSPKLFYVSVYVLIIYCVTISALCISRKK